MSLKRLHFVTLTTNTLKPGFDESFSGKCGDRVEEFKDNYTQYPIPRKGFIAGFKTKHVSYGLRVILVEVLIGGDSGKMVFDVGVISGGLVCLGNDIPLFLSSPFRPVDLESILFRVVLGPTALRLEVTS